MKNNIYSVMIADDHPIFCNGLKTLVNKSASYKVLAEASSGVEAWQIYQTLVPDISILDISMGQMSGLEVAKHILSVNSNAICVIMTMYHEQIFCQEAIGLGIKGYLLKDDASSSILDCLDSVISGQTYISQSLSCLCFESLPDSSGMSMSEQIALLSNKEKMVLKAVAELKTNKEIANLLNLSVRTVQNHRQNICNKLDLSGRQALLQFATAWSKRHQSS